MSPDPVAILVVEDDAATRTFLADNLTADGYALLTAGCVRDAVRALEYHRVDLAILDVGLPDDSGLELVRRVREGSVRADRRLPLIVLSGRAGDSDRVRSFERGADDFVAKPFSYGELRLRVAAVLRRAAERPGEGPLRVGELELDPLAREVRLRGDAGRRWPPRSSRSCARWRPSRRGSSRSPSCCATSGASGRWARRARWTRTPAGCGRSSACTATGT